MSLSDKCDRTTSCSSTHWSSGGSAALLPPPNYFHEEQNAAALSWVHQIDDRDTKISELLPLGPNWDRAEKRAVLFIPLMLSCLLLLELICMATRDNVCFKASVCMQRVHTRMNNVFWHTSFLFSFDIQWTWSKKTDPGEWENLVHASQAAPTQTWSSAHCSTWDLWKLYHLKYGMLQACAWWHVPRWMIHCLASKKYPPGFN